MKSVRPQLALVTVFFSITWRKTWPTFICMQPSNISGILDVHNSGYSKLYKRLFPHRSYIS